LQRVGNYGESGCSGDVADKSPAGDWVHGQKRMRWVWFAVKEEERDEATQRARRAQKMRNEKIRTLKNAGIGNRRKTKMILKSIGNTGNGISTIGI
jgi:hypothetical protein